MSVATQILDGVLLSDGGLRRYSRRALFQLSQSGEEHMDWLLYLRDKCLIPLEVPISAGYPKAFKYSSRGKPYTHCVLSTRLSSTLLSDYYRWYPNGEKVAPTDLTLTPITMANWHMGDGCKSFQGQICLSTNSFSDTGRLFLAKALYDSFGIMAGITSAGELRFAVAEQVDLFINMIAPHIVSSYKYKIEGGTTKKRIDHIRREIMGITE